MALEWQGYMGGAPTWGKDGAAPTNSQSELSGTTMHARSMHPLMLDQDGYDMPSETAASAPLTTLDHGSRLSQVILNSQTEPGYQYAKTTQQPAPQALQQSNDNNQPYPPLEYEVPLPSETPARTSAAAAGLHGANSKETVPAPTRAERAVFVGNGMQETFFGMLNEPDSDCSF